MKYSDDFEFFKKEEVEDCIRNDDFDHFLYCSYLGVVWIDC